MKRSLIFVALLALFGASYWWFSVRSPAAAQVAVQKPPSEDPARVERLALFGPEAMDPKIDWRASGLGCRIIEPGTLPKPGIGAQVRINYVGRLKDGTVFDRSDKPTQFLIGATIPGLSTGLQSLGTGGRATFYIPPSLGYGGRRVMGIPADSGLMFDVEVVQIEP